MDGGKEQGREGVMREGGNEGRRELGREGKNFILITNAL